MSTGRTVRIVLEAATSGFEQGMQRAAAATKALEKEVKRAEKSSQGLGQASGKTATGAAATAAALDGAGKAASSYSGGAEKAAAATLTLGQRIEKNEKHLNTVSTVMAVGGAAALAFAGAAVKAHADFDSAMSGVAAATRAPERDMVKLREAAMQLGADTKFSATEAAGGIEALGRAGVSTRDILGGGLKGSLDLAAAGNLQVADAAELASIAMTQFKLRGRDVPHVADLLAAGAGKAMGEVSDLGMALKQSGLVASQFGLSIEETVGGLSAFASAGLLGSDAGTSFKSMLLKLADPSKETKKTMEALGINAYNAQGQFIGLAGLAGELRDKLSHLTEAQRQQALAQIFGTDAIRAATILYNEGAEGIQRWTDAADDAGYAAEQAAIQNDNLAGDLEKVGGAWDTLAIRMGSAANGPLRAAAQGVDRFLTALGNNEGAAQALFVITAGLGATALAAAGLIKSVVAINNFKQALDGLGLQGSKLSKLPGVLKVIGKATAFTAFAIAAWEGARALAGINEAAAKTGPELTRFTKNVSQGKASLDALFRDTDGKALTSDLWGLIETSYDLKSALELIDGNWFGPLNVDAGKAKDAIKAVGYELEQMDGIQAAAAFGNMRAEFQALGKDATYMAQYFGPYLQKVRDELIAAGPAYEKYANDAEALADIASGKLRPGLVLTSEGIRTQAQAIAEGLPYIDHLGNKSTDAAEKAEMLAQAQEEAAEAAERQRDALDGAADAIAGYHSAVASLIDSEIGFEEAIDNAAEALEKNGRSLDIGTEKGRANMKALNDLGKAGVKLAEDMAATGSSHAEVAASIGRSRDEFLKAADAMGMSAEQAEDTANKLGLIPEETSARLVLQNADETRLTAQELVEILDNIPPHVQSAILTPGVVEAIQNAGLVDAALKVLPPELQTRFVTENSGLVIDEAGKVSEAYDAVQDTVESSFLTPGASEAEKAAKRVTDVFDSVPENVTTLVELEQAGGDPKVLAEAYAELMQLDPKIQKEIRVKYPELTRAAEEAWLLDRNLNGIPDKQEVRVTSPGLPETGDNAKELVNTLQLLPQRKETRVSTPGAEDSLDRVGGVLDVLGSLPPGVAVVVTVPGAGDAAAAANSVKTALDGIPKKTSPLVATVGHGTAIANANQVKAALNGIPKKTTPGIGTSGHGTAIGNAHAVAAALGSIPKKTTPHISTSGHGAAIGNAAAVRAALGSIPRHVGVSITASSNVGSVVAGAAAALASINGRVATTTIRTVRAEVAAAMGGYIGHAAAAIGLAGGGTPSRRSWPNGGVVEGPGTTTSDSIPAMLSRREFVQRARAVEYYGVDVMYALNSMRIPKERLVGYATGGTPSRTEPPRYLPSPPSHSTAPVHVTTQQVDVSQIRQAVADGLAQARIVMDGRVIDARIETANATTARRVVRGA